MFSHIHIYNICVCFFLKKQTCMFFLKKNIGICLCSHSPTTTDHRHTQRYVNEMKLWTNYMGFHIGLLLGYLLGGFNKTQLGQCMSLTLGFLRLDNHISFGSTSISKKNHLQLIVLNQNIDLDPKKNDTLTLGLKNSYCIGHIL